MISPMKGFSTNPPSIATSANAQQVWEHGVTVPTFSKLRTSVHALLEHREKLAGIKTPPTSRRCPRSLADDKMFQVAPPGAGALCGLCGASCGLTVHRHERDTDLAVIRVPAGQ